MNKEVLITGGAGFVGSVLTQLLLSEGYKVKVLDSLVYGVEPLLGFFSNPNFEFILGDIRDPKKVMEISRDCGAIIHLAAIVGYPACKKDKVKAISVNAEGTQVIADATPQDIPFIFASTGSCYGNLEEICTEESLLKPLTIYGESKEKAEEFVKKRKNFTIYRFATGYGVSLRLRLDLMINDFCYKAVREKNLIVYEKHFQRTFIHVMDMARSFMFGIENFEKMNGEIYNVGSEKMNLTKKEIAELIQKKTKYYLHYADFGKDEDKRDYEVSYKKIRELGFKPRVSLNEGIDQLIKLFQVFEVKNEYSNV
jgi:nucleoside-diphosphate-sugar epimerase